MDVAISVASKSIEPLLVGNKDDQIGFRHHSDVRERAKKLGCRIFSERGSDRLHFGVTQLCRPAKDRVMVINKNLGMLMLAIFLIVYGIVTTLALALPVVILGILALIAGILILIGR